MNNLAENLREHICPYFQPIISLQTQMIEGFEVLGRKIGAGIESLGPFFCDETISMKEHIRVDQQIYKEALLKTASLNNNVNLFINQKPMWLVHQYQQSTYPLLDEINKYSLSPSNITIEITEDFSNEPEKLSRAIQHLRSAGCKVAVDDVGTGYSHADRIALIQPDILKIDMNLLKKSTSHKGYKHLLQSYSILSFEMGSSLLIEGVETKEDLQNALDIGARYIQGYFFSKATPIFIQKKQYTSLIQTEISYFRELKIKKHEHLLQLEQQFNYEFHFFSKWFNNYTDMNQMIERVIPYVSERCIRIYIFRETGNLASYVYSKENDGSWSRDNTYAGSNLCWRPYFIPNILKMKRSRQGILSQVYIDILDSKVIHTFSYPINQEYFIFLDIIA